jgi:hypothetical protein
VKFIIVKSLFLVRNPVYGESEIIPLNSVSSIASIPAATRLEVFEFGTFDVLLSLGGYLQIL